MGLIPEYDSDRCPPAIEVQSVANLLCRAEYGQRTLTSGVLVRGEISRTSRAKLSTKMSLP